MKSFLLVLFATLTMVACGDTTSQDLEACPTTAGETHVATANATPSGKSLMLHIVNRACSVVGSNRYHLIPVEDATDMGNMAMAPLYPTAATGTMDTSLTIVKVKAIMPGMGHGGSEPETIDGQNKSFFTVPYQMPGSWQLALTFRFGNEVTDQTVRFDVEVK